MPQRLRQVFGLALALSLFAGPAVAFAAGVAQAETATVEGSVFLQGREEAGGASVKLGALETTTERKRYLFLPERAPRRVRTACGSAGFPTGGSHC